MKENYDNKMNFRKNENGDAVWLHSLARKKEISPKIQRPWQGPFLVTHRLMMCCTEFMRLKDRSRK